MLAEIDDKYIGQLLELSNSKDKTINYVVNQAIYNHLLDLPIESEADYVTRVTGINHKSAIRQSLLQQIRNFGILSL